MSSREEQKRRAREARQAAERVEAARARRQRTLFVAGLVGVLAVTASVAVLVAGGAKDGSGLQSAAIPAQRVSDLDRAVDIADAVLIRHAYGFGINDHVTTPIEYPTNPPTNGPHAPTWTQDGNYAGLAAPPTEQVVHAQEHGRVVIQYRAGLPERQLRQLVALYEEAPRHVLLVENATAMPCDVAATAWGHGVLCPKLTARSFDALRAFRDRYLDRGPETVA